MYSRFLTTKLKNISVVVSVFVASLGLVGFGLTASAFADTPSNPSCQGGVDPYVYGTYISVYGIGATIPSFNVTPEGTTNFFIGRGITIGNGTTNVSIEYGVGRINGTVSSGMYYSVGDDVSFTLLPASNGIAPTTGAGWRLALTSDGSRFHVYNTLTGYSGTYTVPTPITSSRAVSSVETYLNYSIRTSNEPVVNDSSVSALTLQPSAGGAFVSWTPSVYAGEGYSGFPCEVSITSSNTVDLFKLLGY